MNCDKYSVIFSKNKTNGIQAGLLKPNFVLNMLVLLYISVWQLMFYFIFMKNLRTHTTLH
jgi:hypothetical protein